MIGFVVLLMNLYTCKDSPLLNFFKNYQLLTQKNQRGVACIVTILYTNLFLGVSYFQ